MKLEDQVCSLELAKKLKELGVKQESYWSWLKGDADYGDEPYLLGCTTKLEEDECSAFTVAELGEKLPNKIEKNNGVTI